MSRKQMGPSIPWWTQLYSTALGGLLTRLPSISTFLDAVNKRIHSRRTPRSTQQREAKSDLHHMWCTYDGSKLICDAWMKQCGCNKSIVDTLRLQLWLGIHCFIVVQAFANHWLRFWFVQVGDFERAISLFSDRKYLNAYYRILDMFSARGDIRNGWLVGIISV